MNHFFIKAKRKLWFYLVTYLRDKKIYPCIYKSYWHYKLQPKTKQLNTTCYFSAIPNPDAGIGHQLANWIAGYWFARQFQLKFAHIPFSTQMWNEFLGFGEDETSVEVLINNEGYKKVRLPLFNEDCDTEIDLITKIIASYRKSKIVFVAEQDQFCRDHFKVIESIRHKFYRAKARQTNQLIFSKNNFNIAIHIRRGDIIVRKKTENPNLLLRWQDKSYFENVLITVTEYLNATKPVFIYLFSQGEQKDFAEFDRFKNIYYLLDMGAQESFLHMVYSDLLITSKSSFSYKPALLNNGIKICPRNFWHGYPKTKDWVLVEDDGRIDTKSLINALSN